MKLKRLIIISLLLILSLGLKAQNNNIQQYRVIGKVINQADKKPVQGASVFLGNATIGTETNTDGAFTLQNVKPGKYTLIVSTVGYEIFTEPISINNANITLPTIELMTATVTLDEVKIKAKAGKSAYSDWTHDTFLKEFLGTSEYAKDCKILNPEILNIEYDQNTNTITASSSDFLLIENRALGYNIKYKLDKFQWSSNSQSDKSIHYEGSVFFQEMKGTPRQEREWKQNREDIYGNSITHFLRAALNDNLYAEGFRALKLTTIKNPARPDEATISAGINRLNSKSSTYRDSLRYWKKLRELPPEIPALLPQPLTKADMISSSDKPGIFRLGNDSYPILVMYDQNGHFANTKQISDINNLHYLINKTGNKEFTLIDFNEPYAFFDNNGGIFNPNSITFEGAWISNRVASLLPIDYGDEPVNNAGEKPKADTLLQKITRATNAFNAANPVEKVYLHLDRQYYMPGDTVWYKAYDVKGAQHQLPDGNGVLYAELIDKDNQVISRQTIRLTSGLGIGDFALRMSSLPGSYKVRAYTNYMRNAGTDFFYAQYIQVGGTGKNTLVNKHSALSKPDVQFFPEGGDLVVGLNSKIGVKAINSNGLGENITGEIIDDAGNRITKFATTHLGMGAFYLKTGSGKKYSAKIAGTGGQTLIVSLPDARDEGINLSVDNRTDSLYIKVIANNNWLKNHKDAGYYLMAQSGGRVNYSTVCKLAPDFTTEIPKSRFPSGIAQLTLLSQNGEPLGERIIFIRNDDTLKLALSMPATVYKPRQKVNVNIGINSTGLPGPASLSVSVINESRLPVNENAESTILNSLLLTSDLKGYVEQPNYYFLHNDAKTAADLDLLMLTQGYRRFEWKKVTDTSKSALAYQPETALSLSGTVKTPSGKAVSNAKVTFVASRQNFVTDTIADVNGNFKFNDLVLPDSAIIVLRGNKQNNNGNVKITVTPPDYPPVIKNFVNLDTSNNLTTVMANSKEDYDGRLKQYSLRNGIQLKEVKIKSSVIHKPDLAYSANLNGPGNADQVIMGDALINCPSLMDCLNGKVFGVHFKNGNAYNNRQGARFSAVVSTGKNGAGSTDPPPLTIILDGLIMHQSLNDINASDIYSIEVLRSGAYAAIYGSEAYSGALVITTKRGNEHKNIVSTASAGLITVPFKGYYLAKTFYSPNYDVPVALQTIDTRSTIYWQPDIVTGNDGKASFEYYNADTKGTYRIVVEGIDENGNIGRQVYRYKVE